MQVSSPSAVFDGTDHVDADESLPYPMRWLNLYSETKAVSERRVLAANGPDLGYNPKIDREEGLRRFYEWARKESDMKIKAKYSRLAAIEDEAYF